MKEEKEYTVAELAERFGASKHTVNGWIRRNLFPNADKRSSPVGIDYWVVPEGDLKDFKPPGRPGRPLSKNPSAAALAKREQRKNKK